MIIRSILFFVFLHGFGAQAASVFHAQFSFGHPFAPLGACHQVQAAAKDRFERLTGKQVLQITGNSDCSRVHIKYISDASIPEMHRLVHGCPAAEIVTEAEKLGITFLGGGCGQEYFEYLALEGDLALDGFRLYLPSSTDPVIDRLFQFAKSLPTLAVWIAKDGVTYVAGRNFQLGAYDEIIPGVKHRFTSRAECEIQIPDMENYYSLRNGRALAYCHPINHLSAPGFVMRFVTDGFADRAFLPAWIAADRFEYVNMAACMADRARILQAYESVNPRVTTAICSGAGPAKMVLYGL